VKAVGEMTFARTLGQNLLNANNNLRGIDYEKIGSHIRLFRYIYRVAGIP
jgi:hypothetical protein